MKMKMKNPRMIPWVFALGDLLLLTRGDATFRFPLPAGSGLDISSGSIRVCTALRPERRCRRPARA